MTSIIEKVEQVEGLINRAYAVMKDGDHRAAILFLSQSNQVYGLMVNEIMALYRKALQTPSDN